MPGMLRSVVCRKQQVDVAAQKLIAPIAEELFSNAVHQNDAPFAIDLDNRIGSGFQQFTKPAFGFCAQIRFALTFEQFGMLSLAVRCV